MAINNKQTLTTHHQTTNKKKQKNSTIQQPKIIVLYIVYILLRLYNNTKTIFNITKLNLFFQYMIYFNCFGPELTAAANSASGP